MARLFAPSEAEPQRVTLWQRMAHSQGTCGRDAGCPLCSAPEPAA